LVLLSDNHGYSVYDLRGRSNWCEQPTSLPPRKVDGGMKFAIAIKLNRKSGKGSTVRSSDLDEFVISRACDFFDFGVLTQPTLVFFKSHKNLSSWGKRLADLLLNRGFMARSRRTPRMLVSRCSSELFGHKTIRTKKVTTSDRSVPGFLPRCTGQDQVCAYQ
jgi:hypothetical protein